MNYDTMTIESLADDCFRRSGYKINKADLISRITHLCENHKSEVNVALDDVSNPRELLIDFGMDSCFDQKSEQNKKFVTARVDAYLKSNL